LLQRSLAAPDRYFPAIDWTDAGSAVRR